MRSHAGAWERDSFGDERFIDKLEKQIKRPIRFFSRGGDRKSERFKNQLL